MSGPESEKTLYFNLMEKNKKISCVVVSDSMEPLIKKGDRIEVLQCTFHDLRIFDIVVFWDGNKFVSHFVWHISMGFGKYFLLTRSIKDINQDDPPIHISELLGRVNNVKIGWLWKLKILVCILIKKLAS